MVFYEEFDSVFFITLTTIITGFLGLTVRYCLKSKCENISFCWGGVKINRRVDLEAQQELAELENRRNIDNETITTQPNNSI
jgi:hypothetical protein